MSLVKEFKEFAMRGNVVDMAVGIIIGAAFGKIVSSLVKDVIMPPIGVLMGGVNFSDLEVVIKGASMDADAVAIKYGMFIQTVVDFLIVALAVFAMIKIMNSLKKKEEAKPAPAAPKGPTQEDLLAEIRDLLAKPAKATAAAPAKKPAAKATKKAK